MSHESKVIVPSLGELGPAIKALSALTVAFPALPGRTIEVGTVLTRTGVELGIRVELHTTFADFEAWRVALGVAPADIEHQPGARTQTLRAYGAFHGVPVVVTAYGPVYALAQAA
ncbi:hypothetical protein [Streptomyces albicerus]|uniref:hypothetical protein n=1 Tax=Streptomyces albicerus TaxID=2569859 RepID=UPI00124B7D47|nr:hypothetical protein [Streptomyces albicerus]